jgi:hypothetical protein
MLRFVPRLKVLRTFRMDVSEFNPCLLPTFSFVFLAVLLEAEVLVVNKPRRACLYFRPHIAVRIFNFRAFFSQYLLRLKVE